MPPIPFTVRNVLAVVGLLALMSPAQAQSLPDPVLFETPPMAATTSFDSMITGPFPHHLRIGLWAHRAIVNGKTVGSTYGLVQVPGSITDVLVFRIEGTPGPDVMRGAMTFLPSDDRSSQVVLRLPEVTISLPATSGMARLDVPGDHARRWADHAFTGHPWVGTYQDGPWPSAPDQIDTFLRDSTTVFNAVIQRDHQLVPLAAELVHQEVGQIRQAAWDAHQSLIATGPPPNALSPKQNRATLRDAKAQMDSYRKSLPDLLPATSEDDLLLLQARLASVDRLCASTGPGVEHGSPAVCATTIQAARSVGQTGLQDLLPSLDRWVGEQIQVVDGWVAHDVR